MKAIDKDELLKKLDELWEAFLFSPHADTMNYRVEMYEYLKELRKIITAL